MHQEKLVGKINREAVTEQLKQLTKAFSAPEAGEFPVASTREQLEALGAPRTEFETAMFNAEKQRLTDAAHNLKGRNIQEVVWSLKCLTDDVRELSKVLYGDQRANATLALRHLEDAHHRMTLAQASESTTVSSDKQKIENLARQCVRNAETIKDLRAKLE